MLGHSSSPSPFHARFPRRIAASAVKSADAQAFRIRQIHLGHEADSGSGKPGISVYSTTAIAKRENGVHHSCAGVRQTALGPDSDSVIASIVTSRISSNESWTDRRLAVGIENRGNLASPHIASAANNGRKQKRKNPINGKGFCWWSEFQSHRSTKKPGTENSTGFQNQCSQFWLTQA